MGLFTWDSIYDTGVPHIDDQHRNLFEIANRFHAAFLARQGRAQLLEVFNELLNYTATHFADEERLMQQSGCPDYLQHRQQHQKLIELVLIYRKQLERGDDGVEQRAMDFIKMWLNGHILGSDRNYRPYVQKAEAA